MDDYNDFEASASDIGDFLDYDDDTEISKEFLTPENISHNGDLLDYDTDEETFSRFLTPEIAQDNFVDFIEKPGKKTILSLDDDDIELLRVISEQVVPALSKDIYIEYMGRNILINSKLSKQIRNYLNKYRYRYIMDKDDCVKYTEEDIRHKYDEDQFFSYTECKNAKRSLPQVMFNGLIPYIEDEFILDETGLHTKENNINIDNSRCYLVKKVSVIPASSDQPLNNLDILNMCANITHITFGDDFNQNIDNLNLTKISHIIFGKNFNQSIDNLKIPSLTHLTFGYDFNQELNLKIPQLTHLTFGYMFNNSLNNLEIPNLTHLTFGHSFDQRINNLDLRNLKHLTFGFVFSQSISLYLPELTHLTFGSNFYHSIVSINLPSLTHLTFGDFYNTNINNLHLPSLKYLKLGNSYMQLTHFTQRNFPQLTHLIFGDAFRGDIYLNLPELKHLVFGKYFDMDIDNRNIITPKLKELVFGLYFNKSINMLELPKLKHLVIAKNYDKPIDYERFPKLVDIGYISKKFWNAPEEITYTVVRQ